MYQIESNPTEHWYSYKLIREIILFLDYRLTQMGSIYNTTNILSFFLHYLFVVALVYADNFTHGDLHPGNVLVTDDCKFV